MTSLRHLFLSLFLVLLALNVQASPNNDNKSQEVSFQVESSMLVENDEMQARLIAEGEGRDPSTLSNEINQTMAAALKILKKEKSIKSETGSYSTHPIYNKNRIVGWRISQQLRLHSKNFKVMNTIIGQLQDTLHVKSIHFDISKDAKEKYEEILIQSAISKFTKRASLITNNLKAPDYKIKRLDINTQPQHRPAPMMRTMTMEADMATPITTTGGESNVSVFINAVINITP